MEGEFQLISELGEGTLLRATLPLKQTTPDGRLAHPRG
jgi:hypothetical protein